MEGEILNIDSPIIFDESIAHYEVHAQQPYTSSTYNNSDEIRITVQNQDHCLLPSKSSIHVSGKLIKNDGNAVERTKLVSNGICHLFDEAKYELNGVEIDKNKNVGLTSLMKNYVSFDASQNKFLENVGLLEFGDTPTLTNNNGYFDVCIPLNMIFGFAEDYQKVIINAKHELILTRSRTDLNAVIQTAPLEEFKIVIEKVEWLLPYIKLSDARKFKLLKYIEKDPSIPISFRTWELYEYPLLPVTPKHIWSVKTSTQLEKPRFIVLGFQRSRKNNTTLNSSYFDHSNISDVKLFLKSQCYPYGNMNLDIDKNQYSTLYEMFTNFQATYYGKESQPILTKKEFLEYAPLVVIDCSNQNESLKSGPVDIRLEFESKENFHANTSAYCLILHDRIVEYKPISGIVRKIV
ncbi:uncharacterized protein LOC127279888 [Leptopilina boulardi]|uniref:uncharacterized protein LOC127279888 n=1 Tax=Leptopilina boulardi TaxID=63433 RepID=UPI0021F61CA7|nr:uncharacterized protein LOC127279888 [Leptopilina boulardi]